MVNVVFDCDFDAETLKALQDLRQVRKEVLTLQIKNISETLTSLVAMGALKSSERFTYQEDVLDDLKSKLSLVESRLEEPNTIHSDELEMYLSLLSSP